MEANPEGIVSIHGKQYQTVAYRVHRFREEHPEHTIETQLIMQDDEKVIMKALILAGDSLLATGYAEEVRGASHINKTSALEVAETSAIGRALAALGLAGTEYATADEVAGAIGQQNDQQYIDYMNLVRDNWESIAAAKDYLQPVFGENENQPNVSAARECLKELGEDTYMKLWKAPSKGGVLTTHERTILKVKPEDAL